MYNAFKSHQKINDATNRRIPMTKQKRPATKKVSEDAKKCHELYEEIHDLQEYFGWTNEQLCAAITPIIEEDDSISRRLKYDSAREKQFYEKLRKTFQKAKRKDGTLTDSSRALLETVRDCIYMTEEYRNSELCESDMPLKVRKFMAKISEAIHRKIYEKPQARKKDTSS